MNDIITVKDLQLWYGQTKALKGVSMDIPEKSITALIGPSGCGKSTFLKTLDRMNDLIPGVRIEGEVKYNGQDIFAPSVDVNELRREYLRTAAAKGLSPFRVYGKHLLRNAAIQIITRASAALPFLFTGSLLLESFFGIPGLGFAGVDALYNSDLQLLKALVITSAILFVVMNLLADLAYAWADPRIRLE